MNHSGLTNKEIGLFIEKDAPLLKYFDFGGDFYVDEVHHNRGGYPTDTLCGLKIMARFDYPDKTDVHQQPCIWAYKPNVRTGRVVVSGSHPEYGSAGEKRDLTASMLMYAIDGVGLTLLKGILVVVY